MAEIESLRPRVQGNGAIPIASPDDAAAGAGNGIMTSELTAAAIIAQGGGGGGPTLASQAEAEAGINNLKFMSPLRVAQYAAANPPSTGGDYPPQTLIISANKTLTSADQGVLIVYPGVEITMPASANDGDRYTIIPAGGSITIIGVINQLGTSPSTANTYDLIAFNTPPPTSELIWAPIGSPAMPWIATDTYAVGDIVQRNNKFYMSRTMNSKNEDPESSFSWEPIGWPGALYYFSAFFTGTHSIASLGNYDLIADNAFLPNSGYDIGTGFFTVPMRMSGIWEFGFNLKAILTADAGYLQASVQIDGSDRIVSLLSADAAIPGTLSAVTGPLYVADGQVVKVHIDNNSAVSQDIMGAGAASFWGRRIG